ncbi:hypothetical protein GPECTOR_1279g532 [Gonium pectorale]|uniref:Uncharacterized protein n=1 Tax=Gonium pectorale TaxID=33097 RepID=A0A150FTH6_GONPE|nr:hypothetical protein GPECTOR_1279g532 [Gonium pectorale]|eukprot:KXZ40927.1 hypothetical protein GPECTOR_1279g532 [Gonium pectorale]
MGPECAEAWRTSTAGHIALAYGLVKGGEAAAGLSEKLLAGNRSAISYALSKISMAVRTMGPTPPMHDPTEQRAVADSDTDMETETQQDLSIDELVALAADGFDTDGEDEKAAQAEGGAAGASDGRPAGAHTGTGGPPAGDHTGDGQESGKGDKPDEGADADGDSPERRTQKPRLA